MTRLRRILAAVVAAGFAGLAVVFVWLSLTEVSAADLPPLNDGDIIFQYSGSSQSLPILLASKSPYTHMGIIDTHGTSGPVVIEASSMVKRTPLDQWIARGMGHRITIKRLKAMTVDKQADVIKAADKYLGHPYDIYFLDSEDAIYCSELVRLAFRNGGDVELGKLQKVRDLDLDYAPVRALIESRWQKYPLCKEGRQPDFESCYKVMLDQSLVTPISIAEDPKLDLVFSNFGVVAQ